MSRIAQSALLATALSALAPGASAFFLQGLDFIVTERADPVVEPGIQSSHVHSVIGGSNFDLITNTSYLQQSECTSAQIKEDKSNYWFPVRLRWANGTFSSLTGGAVTYQSHTAWLKLADYLFGDEAGSATAFPDNFRMVSGDPMLRTWDESSKAQKAVSFNCLDFEGTSVTYNWLPSVNCPSGIRAQINFPMCWDGKNTDSDDHKSHVAFPSGGPDSGTCDDPAFPVTLPRIFIEVYWASGDWASKWGEAMNTTQPFVYLADFINGWEDDKLQNLMDQCGQCTSQAYGGIDCCYDKGVVTKNEDANNCKIDSHFDEQVTGNLATLPGNNPVTYVSGAPMGAAASASAPASSSAAASSSESAAPSTSAPAGNANIVVPHRGHHNRLAHTRRGSF
ncbi:hypothetical protein EV714DRAFT_245468 [Schizophyllum commune]